MQFHSHSNQSHFHKNGFALRLALKQRHKELGTGLLRKSQIYVSLISPGPGWSWGRLWDCAGNEREVSQKSTLASRVPRPSYVMKSIESSAREK